MSWKIDCFGVLHHVRLHGEWVQLKAQLYKEQSIHLKKINLSKAEYTTETQKAHVFASLDKLTVMLTLWRIDYCT